jgi:hypothetical protein
MGMGVCTAEKLQAWSFEDKFMRVRAGGGESGDKDQ